MDKSEEKKMIEHLKYVIKCIEDNKVPQSAFNRLQEAVKDSWLYDPDDVEADFDSVIDYINWGYLGHGERESILRALDIDDTEADILERLVDIRIRTLDDEYKIETIFKLYKAFSSNSELEQALGEDILSKIKYIEI